MKRFKNHAPYGAVGRDYSGFLLLLPFWGGLTLFFTEISRIVFEKSLTFLEYVVY
jgi:hypothetical protein